jgi:hypothetical protein
MALTTKVNNSPPDRPAVVARSRADRGPIEGRSTQVSAAVPKRPHSRIRRLMLHSVHDLDGRSRAARRAKAVVADLVQALGGPDAVTPAQRQACERAAMLCAIADDLAARQLAGLSVTLDEVLRADGTARRAVRAILANRPEPKPTERPGLAIARRRWAEADRAKAQAEKDSNHAE